MNCAWPLTLAGWRPLLLLCASVIGEGHLLADGQLDQMLDQAQALHRQGNLAEALILASKAVTADPKNPQCYYVRGRLYAEDREHGKAVADFDQALAMEPRGIEIYQLRGIEQFKLAHFKESCADFDRFVERRPQSAAQHWQRGIAYYYAGRYEDGRKQFELHQTVNPNDVENAVWHFLCVARLSGLAKARGSLIPIKDDARAPMMQIYAVFAGKAKPEDVLAAAKGGYSSIAQLNHQLFYAHFYMGLFYEASGNEKLAAKHLAEAAGAYKVEDYMGEVARVHLEWRRQQGK